MKKQLFSIMMLLATNGAAWAQNSIVVEDFTIPENGEGRIVLKYVFDKEGAYSGYGFKLITPTGIGFYLDGDGDATCELAACHDKSHGSTAHWNDVDGGFLKVAVTSQKSASISGMSGVLMEIPVKADPTLKEGDVLTGKIEDIILVRVDGAKSKPDNSTFTITIGPKADSRMILDETSTVKPEAATGVDVRVRRTLTADVWNTIVLPFSMTSQQMAEAFGDGVQLADFTGCEATYANEDDYYASAIKVSFSDASAIEANHPYIIKVKEPISEFTVDGVDINPEEDLSVNRDEYRTGSGTKKDPYVYHYNSFVGTYMANTDVPELTIFLNGNKFWYSTGLTKMRAYRAYFDFYDVLADVEGAESKISFVVDGEATDIMGILAPRYVEGDVYNVQGLHVGKDVDMNRLPKGIYIVNGKKYSVK